MCEQKICIETMHEEFAYNVDFLIIISCSISEFYVFIFNEVMQYREGNKKKKLHKSFAIESVANFK